MKAIKGRMGKEPRMDDWLAPNLRELKKKDPALGSRLETWSVSPSVGLVYSQRGLPVTRAGNITLHSLVDPEKEAREWAAGGGRRGIVDASQKIGVLGFGTGYHIRALLKEGMSLVVLEPSLDILRLAFGALDFLDLIPRVSWVVDRNKIGELSLPIVFRHRPSVRFYKAAFPLWLESVSPRETMGDLQKDFKNDAAISGFLKRFAPEAPAELSRLAEGLRREAGPGAHWQTMFLLMEEIQRQGSRRSRTPRENR